MAQSKPKQVVNVQPNDVAIQRINTIAVLGADGALHDVYRVQFMVREHGPFFIDTPSEGFDAGETRQRIDARAAEILALLG